ncbi:hypothetical protein D3C78_976780 [compost metagenome]
MLLGDAAEVEVCGVDMTVALDQLLEEGARLVPGLGLDADQGQRQAQVVVFGKALQQLDELLAGGVQLLVFQQLAGVGQAQALVVGVLAQPGLEQGQGFLVAIQRAQQAGAQQQRGDLAAAGRVCLEAGQGFLAALVLLQQHGAAEDQLGIVRVAREQALEALQQAGAGFRVGLRGGQGEEVEVGVALGLQHLLHVQHGLLVAPGAGQLDGGDALGVEVVLGAVGPQQGGFQGGLVGAQVLGDAEGALGHRRVAGGVGLLDVVGQGDIEAVALTGQLGDQQAVQGVAAERGAGYGGNGRARRGVGLGSRRRSVGVGRGQNLAATQQGEGAQQREGFVYGRHMRAHRQVGQS